MAMSSICVLLTFLPVSHALRLPKFDAAEQEPIHAASKNEKAIQWLIKEAARDFPNKHLDSIPSVRMPEDACNPDLLLGGTGNPGNLPATGLGGELNLAINVLAAAAYGNLSVSLIENSILTNILKESFKQILPTCGNVNPKQHGGLILRDAVISFLTKLTKKDRKFVTDLKHSQYSHFLQYNDQVQSLVTENLEKLGVPAGSKYLGIHIRRGDKIKELSGPGPNNEMFAKKILESQEESEGHFESRMASLKNKILEVTDDENTAPIVYVASDDKQVHDWMEQHLGHKFVFKGQHAEGAIKHEYVGGNTKISVLTDIEALRNAETFIGTATSNFGRLVYHLRPPAKKSISMDDQGDWLRRWGDGKTLLW